MFMRGDYGKDRDLPFFYVRVCHPNADSYREISPQQIYKQHETEKKRQRSSRVMEIENGVSTPLIYHNRRDGRRMSQISLPIGRTYINQERRALRSNNIVDKN